MITRRVNVSIGTGNLRLYRVSEASGEGGRRRLDDGRSVYC